MIKELMHYLGAGTSVKGAYRLGYVYEAAALQVKHGRCRAAWQPHVAATGRALLGAAARVGRRGTALIVGGGVSGDLPIPELLAYFERIVLLDIVFTYPTRQLAGRWPGRVFCCCHDVTGLVAWLAVHRRFPPVTALHAFGMPASMPLPDWIASVNCLTQLPLAPVNWLSRFVADERELETFGRMLLQAHLDWLRHWRLPVCLLSEVEVQRRDRDGNLIENVDYRPLLEAFRRDSACFSRWTWTVHPPGELPQGYWETRTVEAWEYPKTNV